MTESSAHFLRYLTEGAACTPTMLEALRRKEGRKALKKDFKAFRKIRLTQTFGMNVGPGDELLLDKRFFGLDSGSLTPKQAVNLFTVLSEEGIFNNVDKVIGTTRVDANDNFLQVLIGEQVASGTVPFLVNSLWDIQMVLGRAKNNVLHILLDWDTEDWDFHGTADFRGDKGVIEKRKERINKEYTHYLEMVKNSGKSPASHIKNFLEIKIQKGVGASGVVVE